MGWMSDTNGAVVWMVVAGIWAANAGYQLATGATFGAVAPELLVAVVSIAAAAEAGRRDGKDRASCSGWFGLKG